MGRKTILTPELQDDLVRVLRAGNYVITACEYVGIHVSTYHEWITKGEDGHEPYADFAEAVKEARAAAVVRNLGIINQAAPKQWQAAAWFLERTRPAEWGRKDRTELEVSGPDKGPIRVEDARRQLLDMLDED